VERRYGNDQKEKKEEYKWLGEE
jgi:hypothetical protein